MENDYINMILIEKRPKIKSCNVYVKLNNAVIDSNSIDIILNDFNIIFKFDQVEIKVFCENLKFVSNTLSNLKLADDKRLLTFHSMFESMDEKCDDEQKTSLDFFLNLKERIKQIQWFSCANCKQIISNRCKFDRILPLPKSLDFSDWFCHHNQDLNVVIEPKPNEIFYIYSNCSIHCSNVNLNEIVLEQQQRCVVKCKKCCFQLGYRDQKLSELKDLKIVEDQLINFKFWNDTVCFLNDANEVLNKSNSKFDFCHLVLKLIEESNFVCKFVLECQDVNRIHFICVWVLDKALDVLVANRNDSLTTKQIVKLFYFVNAQNDKEESKGELKKWLCDVNLERVRISYSMFCSGIKLLKENATIFSATYNEIFTISYLEKELNI